MSWIFFKLIFKRLYVVTCLYKLTIYGIFVSLFLLFSLSLCYNCDGCCHGLLSLQGCRQCCIDWSLCLGCFHSLYLPFYCCSTVEVHWSLPLAWTSITHLRGVRIKLIWFMLLPNRLILLFVIDVPYPSDSPSRDRYYMISDMIIVSY